jgi:hypothetical protein
MAAAQLLDLATFVTMVRRFGIDSELNPLVISVFQDGGVPVLILAKLALVILVGAVAVALLVASGRTERRAGWVLLGAAIAAGVVGGWTNAVTMGPL